jgi:hypothetical protein
MRAIRRISTKLLPACVTSLAVILSACGGDSTSANRNVKSVTYDFVASFDNFSFETQGPIDDPPDCPTYAMYCTHTRPTTMGSLAGSFVTTDSTGADTAAPYTFVSASLTGQFCTTWDMSGCTAVGAPATTVFGGSLSYSSADVETLQESSGGGPVLHLYNLHTTADSIYGDLSWSQYVYRSPPTLSGHWVARLHK